MSYSNEYIRYGDDFEILNNVKDKEWTDISIKIRQFYTYTYGLYGQIAYDEFKQVTLQELYEYLREAESGRYEVEIELSWDDERLLNVDDVYAAYATYFVIDKRLDDGFDNYIDTPLYRNYVRYMLGDERFYGDYLLQCEGSKNYGK